MSTPAVVTRLKQAAKSRAPVSEIIDAVNACVAKKIEFEDCELTDKEAEFVTETLIKACAVSKALKEYEETFDDKD